jgi:hypothetical protein
MAFQTEWCNFMTVNSTTDYINLITMRAIFDYMTGPREEA